VLKGVKCHQLMYDEFILLQFLYPVAGL